MFDVSPTIYQKIDSSKLKKYGKCTVYQTYTYLHILHTGNNFTANICLHLYSYICRAVIANIYDDEILISRCRFLFKKAYKQDTGIFTNSTHYSQRI